MNDEFPDVLWKATEPEKFDDDAMLRAVQTRIRQGTAPTKQLSFNSNVYRWIACTAAIIIAIVGIKYIPTTQTQSIKTYTTSPGQRAKINLADGTQITLAPATTIQVSGRNIALVGEAVFNVTQHISTPFTVTTGNTVTRVLGTTFNVRAYKNEPVRVAVGDGKVSVASVTLVAGQGATVASNGSVTPMSDASVTAALSRASGRLTFDHVPAREVLDDLSRWYGVRFILRDAALANIRITTVIDEPNINNEVIRSLALALQARAVSNGDGDRTITFYQEQP